MPRRAERGGEERVAACLRADERRLRIDAHAPRAERFPGLGIGPPDGTVALAVAPRPLLVEFQCEVLHFDGLREVGPVAPVGLGPRPEKLLLGFDPHHLASLLGVEAQVKQVGERFEQFDLADLDLRHVGERERRSESRAGEEERAERTLPVDRNRRPGCRPGEVDLVEIARLCGRHPLGGGPDADLHGGFSLLADVARVEGPVSVVGFPPVGTEHLEPFVGEVAWRSRHCGRPGAERSPDGVGCTVDPPRQAMRWPVV